MRRTIRTIEITWEESTHVRIESRRVIVNRSSSPFHEGDEAAFLEFIEVVDGEVESERGLLNE